MKILCIGGAGYLGGVLVPALTKEGYDVTVFDMYYFPTEPYLGHVNTTGNIVNSLALEGEIKTHDVIVLIAAIVGEPACQVLSKEVQAINYAAPTKISELCKKYRKKLVFTSTCFFYGFDGTKVLTEKSPVQPKKSLYGLTKYNAEKKIRLNCPNAAILRFSTLFGESCRMRYDLVVNRFIAQALNKENLTLHGGNQWRPFLHIKDAARAIIHAIQKDLRGEYNVLYANYQIKTVAEIIAASLNVKIKHTGTKDTRNYLVSPDKLHKTGFTPTYSILDAVDEIQKTKTWKNYENPIYSNEKWYAKLKKEGKI